MFDSISEALAYLDYYPNELVQFYDNGTLCEAWYEHAVDFDGPLSSLPPILIIEKID